MDKFEQKLKNYYKYNCEYQPEAISGEFLRRLKALESGPKTKRARRRYVMPVAAAVALAICLGSVWAWLHFFRPGNEQALPPNVTLEDPGLPDADSPAPPSEPAPRETKPKTELIYTSKPPDEEPSPALPIFAPKPVQDGTAQPNSDTPADSRPEESAPVTQDDTTSAPPEDTAPITPEDTTSGKPIDPPPAAEPSKTDDAAGAASEENAQDSSPQTPPNISAYCRMAGGRETLILTLLSTGECVEIDVSGLAPAIADDSQGSAGEGSTGDAAAATQAGGAPYFGTCSAFGWQIVYVLARSGDGTIYAQIVDVRQN